jgi:DNA topoisomerase III
VVTLSFNSANVSAHHAIIPTAATGHGAKLSKPEQQLYHLIARAYVAQFYPAKASEHTTLSLDIAGYRFEARGTVVLQAGWSALYRQEAQGDDGEHDADATDECTDLRRLQAGDMGTCIHVEIQRQHTKPPARYTQGTLLKDLANVAKYVRDPEIKQLLQRKDLHKKGEHGGIGTPATRSTILETLLKRGFLTEKGKHLISTELGRAFIEVLPEKAKTPDMTALWHAEQERIEAGEQTVDTFIAHLMAYLQVEVEALKTTGLALKGPPATVCPACGEGVLRKRKGTKGAFWGCHRYPECRATYPDQKGQPDIKAKQAQPDVSSEHVCEACGKGLVRRPAKQGKTFWWGCSGYPGCKQTYRDNQGVPAPWPDATPAAEAAP